MTTSEVIYFERMAELQKQDMQAWRDVWATWSDQMKTEWREWCRRRKG